MKRLKIFSVLGILLLLSGCMVKKGNKNVATKQITYLTRAHNVEQLKIWKEVIESFEKQNPDIKVKIENVNPGSYWEKLQVMLGGGTTPDVVFMESQRIIPFIKKETIEDLTPYIEKEKDIDIGDFYPQALNAYKYKNKIYGLPNDIAIWVVFYNKDLFEKYGVAFPKEEWTWNDYLDTAKKLTKDIDNDGRTDIYGTVVSIWRYYLWIWQNGGDIFDNNKNPKKAVFGSNRVVDAVKFMVSLKDKYKVAPDSAQLREMNDDMMFRMGRIAMRIDGHWMVPYYADNIKNFKWDVVSLPKGKYRANWGGGSGFAIMKGSKDKESSWKFIKFVTGKEGQKILMKYNFSTPARKSIANSKEFLSPPPDSENIFINEIKYGKMLPKTENWLEMDSMIQNELEKIWYANNEPAKVCKEIEKKLNTMLKK